MKKLYQYPFSCIIQLLLCKIRIACHNPFRDECTPDFECYSFVIDGVKINAIIDKPRAKHHFIGVQLVALALKDKMKLRRDKDKTYMLNLIANLASL